MARSGRPIRGWRGQFARIFVYATLIVAGLVVLVPFLFALSGSFKTSEDVFTYPPRMLPRVPATAESAGQHVHVHARPERRRADHLHRSPGDGEGRCSDVAHRLAGRDVAAATE